MNEQLFAQLLQIIANSKLFSQLLEQTVISDDSFFASINTGTQDAKKIKLPLLRGYSGDWDAYTNTPALANGAGVSATVYRVSTSGTKDLGNGAVTYGLDDIIYYNGSKWVKLIQSQISDIVGLQSALDALQSSLIPQGSWNASTNTPDITTATTAGYYWIVTVPGSTDLDGETDWKVNDWAIKTDSGFTKIDNTDKILEVIAGAGLTGGGTEGILTLNAVGGDGITVNPNGIQVDNTVIRTTGDQSIAGDKTFTNDLAAPKLNFGYNTYYGRDMTISGIGDGTFDGIEVTNEFIIGKLANGTGDTALYFKYGSERVGGIYLDDDSSQHGLAFYVQESSTNSDIVKKISLREGTTIGNGLASTLPPENGLAVEGAATFASSVSAGAGIFSGDVNINDSKLQITDTTPQIILSVPSGGLDSRIYNDGAGNFIIGHGTNSATPPTALTIATDLSATFASSVSATDGLFSGDLALGGTGQYTTNQSLNIDGTGLAIKNDVNGSDNNWSIIHNTAGANRSNLVFGTGAAATALTLANSGAATFSSSVSAVGAVTGSNLSGTNTGDQDLSGYLLNTTDTLTGDLTVTGDVSATKFIEEYTVLEPTGDFTLSNSSHYINYIGSASGDITIPSGLDKQVWEITVSAFNATFVAGTGVTIVVIQNEQTLSNNVAYKHSAKLIHKGSNQYLLIKY